MQHLISIIIPCYNAEKWLREAIQSCLDQDYRPIEIVVVDDGSTDNSVEVLRSYGDAVVWEAGPNRGGCAARNRALALTHGQYIQFLDADDYLLPGKFSQQVRYLESSTYDAVYSDWQYHFHDAGSPTPRIQRVIAGERPDLLDPLVAHKWWVINNSFLWRREIVERAGGWDEGLKSSQDRDFFLSALLVGGKVGYLPGTFAAYRRYGLHTVSFSNPARTQRDRIYILKKAEAKLQAAGLLSVGKRQALALGYFDIARAVFGRDRKLYRETLRKVRELDPDFRPRVSPAYDLLHGLFGFEVADTAAHLRRRLQPRKPAHFFDAPGQRQVL